MADKARKAEVVRETKETSIKVSVDVDGSGKSKISTGVGFFDHMLESFARHAMLDMKVRAQGDLHIDFHHTTEDTGIAIGEAGSSGFTADKTARRERSVSRTRRLRSDCSSFASSAARAAESCFWRSSSAPFSSSRRLLRKRATAPSSASGSSARTSSAWPSPMTVRSCPSSTFTRPVLSVGESF